MEHIDSVIAEFGHQMGIPHLNASKSQVVSFIFEKRGVIFLEKGYREVLIYLARKIDFVDRTFCEKALKLSHYDTEFGLFMSANFKDEDKLVILTRIREEDFTLQMIERALNNLTQFFEKLSD